jgi:signal transduction histidine kinase
VFRSLSLRLFAIFVVLAGIFIYAATAGLRWIYEEDELRELISGHLALHLDYVRRDIGNPPRIDRALAITERVPVDIRIIGPNLDWTSHPAFPDPDELLFGQSEYFSRDPGALVNRLDDVAFARRDGRRYLRIDQSPYSVFVSSPRMSDDASRPPLLAVILGFGLAWLLIAYLCVRWLFRPIDAIRAGAARIGSGNFDYRIRDYRNDQLGDLAEDINALAADVREMLDGKQQLLLGISHELRSPLSRMRLALEFLEDGPRKDDLRAELIEMEQILSTLLEAERLNVRHAPIRRAPVVVRDLVDTLIDNYFARDRGRLRVSFDDTTLVADVDPARVILLLKNLLGNALQYSEPAAGPVALRVSRDGEYLVFDVRDRGPGIAADQAARIGEPFYRGDPSRARSTGGSGLGLYLARLIAEAHDGSLRLRPEYTEGACLEARLRAFAATPAGAGD